MKLFEEAAERQRARGARFVEASVSAENRSILMVLRQYARAAAPRSPNSCSSRPSCWATATTTRSSSGSARWPPTSRRRRRTTTDTTPASVKETAA